MNTLCEWIATQLFDGLRLNGLLTRENKLAVSAPEWTDENGTLVGRYAQDGATVTAEGDENAVVLTLHFNRGVPNGSPSAFAPERAVTFPWGNLQPDGIVANQHDCPWWMIPAIGTPLSALKPKTQGMLLKVGEKHISVLPLTGDNFRCEFDGTGAYLSSDTAGLYALNGAFLAVAWDADPYVAIDKNYKNAHDLGAIRVPLVAERKRPEIFKKFGFCTWDCFYRDVTEEKIFQKLDEFKAKNIPVKWMIIDDGWMTTTEGSFLAGFEENREKFPRGLAACIKDAKEKYGLEQVGVWHAFDGYWRGVDRKSPLYEAQKENLVITPSGLAIPSFDVEKAYKFWDTWHSYLASCGVDFVKVDNQSSHTSHIVGALPAAEGCRIAHEALERSVDKNFNGTIINCMGMDMENVLARHTAVSRNSDDFFPRREHGFRKHIIQNVYNALWHGRLHICDFDMWWSSHESAIQSAVLRHISGSPIYVSDTVGNSNRSRIMVSLEKDGSVKQWDDFARPTPDCLYTDCKEGKLLKIWNRSGNEFALAIFNVTEKPLTEYFRATDIPGVPADAVLTVKEKINGFSYKVYADEKLAVNLPADGVAYYIFKA